MLKLSETVYSKVSHRFQNFQFLKAILKIWEEVGVNVSQMH